MVLPGDAVKQRLQSLRLVYRVCFTLQLSG
jgi:hypothetical protein